MNKANNRKGFTIIESLVALTILVLVISGVTSAVQTGISSYTFSKDQVVAFYLAQEGVEYIRNVRDTNCLTAPCIPGETAWLTGIAANSNDPCYFGSYCNVDAVTSALVRCGNQASSCDFLRQDPSSGLFGLNPAWPATNFRRSIVLSNINPNEISILVTIDWSKGSVTREFKARENILNWQ